MSGYPKLILSMEAQITDLRNQLALCREDAQQQRWKQDKELFDCQGELLKALNREKTLGDRLHAANNQIMALQMECKELERKNEILRQSLDDATCPLPIQDEV